MTVALAESPSAAADEDPAGPAGCEVEPAQIWTEPLPSILGRLGTSSAGLDTARVEVRATKYGPNDPAAVKRSPRWVKFIARFRNPLVIILLVASGLSAAAGDVTSFIVVATIVVISITLDFVQEVRAESAVEALRRSVAVEATVRRDGATAC